MNDVKYFKNTEDGLEAILTEHSEFFTVRLYDTDGKQLINLKSFREYSQAIDFAKSFVFGIEPKNTKPLYVTIPLD
jgi:hypothetical protein